MNPIDALAKLTSPRSAKGSGETATAPIIIRAGSGPRSTMADWSDRNAIRDGYKGNVWVSAAIRRKSTAAARVPLVVNVKMGEEWVTAPEATGSNAQPARDLLALLERPNPKMSRADFLARALILMDLTGNFLAHKVGRGGAAKPDQEVIALWPLPSGFRPVYDDAGYPEAYTSKESRGRKKYLSDEVWHLLYPDPEDHGWGTAPLQAAAAVVDADNEAMLWNRDSMQRRAMADLLLVSRDNTIPSPEQYQALRQMADEQLQGRRNAGGVRFIPGNWEPVQLDRSPVEMDFVESQGLSIQKIAAAFGVPIPLLSTEVQTYSNYENAMRDLWVNTVIPWLDLFVDGLNRDVVPHFGDRDEIWVGYDLSNVEALRDDQDAKASTMQRYVNVGVPYNEAIELLDLEVMPIEGDGDIPHGVSLGRLLGSRPAQLEGGADPDEQEAALVAAEDVQQTALNGAQVQALQSIIQSVVDEIMPADAAIELIQVAFPTVDEDIARRMIESAVRFERSVIDITPAKSKGLPAPSEAKAALLDELAPLWTLADKTAATVATIYRRVAGDLRDRVNREQVRAALASGSAEDVAQAVGVERLRTDFEVMVPAMASASGTATGMAGERLSRGAGRRITIDDAVAGRFAAGAVARSADFVSQSSARGISEALVLLRTAELGAAGLAALAELFTLFAVVNGDQAKQGAKLLLDLLGSGASPEDATRKAQRLLEKAVAARALGIGGDLGPRSAWGAQRAAFDHARETAQVRDVRRIWVDSDDADVCPECISLDEQTVGGSEVYVSPISGASYVGPPDPHPNSCRCGEGMAEVVV